MRCAGRVFGAGIRCLRKRSAGALGSCQPTRGGQDRQGGVVGAKAKRVEAQDENGFPLEIVPLSRELSHSTLPVDLWDTRQQMCLLSMRQSDEEVKRRVGCCQVGELQRDVVNI
jgi:hypothetical protein